MTTAPPVVEQRSEKTSVYNKGKLAQPLESIAANNRRPDLKVFLESATHWESSRTLVDGNSVTLHHQALDEILSPLTAKF